MVHRTSGPSRKRRRFLQTLGLAGVAGLAGCLGDDDDTDDADDGDDADDDVGTAAFAVIGLNPEEIELTQGESFDVSALIENSGDASGTADVELLIADEAIDSESVDIDAGNNQSVTFSDVPTANLDPDVHEFSVQVDESELTGTLSLFYDIPEDERPASVEVAAGEFSTHVPSDATQLWDGVDATLDGWEAVSMGPSNRVSHREASTVDEWGEPNLQGDPDWDELEDGTGNFLREGSNDIWTKEHFEDCQFHMEYRMDPDATGSGESLLNSGLFFLGHYEIQVLENYDNVSNAQSMHGSIYGQHAPLANPARDRNEEQWQTYDVFWRPPRWENDTLVQPAQATVIVNGVVKLAHVNADGPTGGGGGDYHEGEEHPPHGPILLQAHTDPNEFRNVWVRDLDEVEPAYMPDELPEYGTEAGEGFPDNVHPGGVGTSGVAPSDATVLIDDDLSGWVHTDGGDPEWEATGEYVEVEPGSGDIESEATFGDSQIHLEWRVPEPEGVGTARGKSGVFLHGAYGFQILDNYGNPTPVEDWVGAYIGHTGPEASPILEPGEWQSMDIIWQAPQFDGGELTHPGQASVVINGVTVQKRLEIDGPNVGGSVEDYEPHDETGPLRLQDGGSRVQFRNVWIRELDASAN